MKAKRVLSPLAFCPAAVFIGSSAAAGEELRDSPLRTTLPADRVVLPMAMHDVQPVVAARVNGQGPFRFLVDTGAAGCGRISAELADALELEEVGEIIAGDPSGQNTMVVKKVGVDAVALGGAVFEDLSMMRRDQKGIIDAQRDGMVVDGVIPGGAAEEAGLRKGDRITHINLAV